MPVSEVSGITGVIQGQQDPAGLQQFAEHLQRAQESKRREAMAQIDWLMKMTTESGGRFTPDPAELEKLGKQAGLPKAILNGPGGAAGAFQGMAEHAKITSKAAEDTARAQSEQAQHDRLITHLETQAADPDATEETRDHALAMLGFAGKRTLAQIIDADALKSLNKEQRDALVQRHEDELLGKPSDAQLNKIANKMIPQLTEDYDGDINKAAQAANLIARRQPVPAELQPPMTDAKLKRDAEIAVSGVELGWTPTMIAQAQALKTMDTAKLSRDAGWNLIEVDALKPLKVRQAEAEERRAAAAESEARSYGRMADISAEREKADSAVRIARAYKELMSVGGKDPEMKALLAQLEAVRRAQVIDKKAIPPAAIKGLTDQLMKSLTGTNGEPLMREGDVPAFFGLGNSKGWILSPPADTKALEGEKGPANPDNMSLADPKVLEQFMKNFPGDVNKFMDSIPGGINKFGSWLDDLLAGGHGSRGASGQF